MSSFKLPMFLLLLFILLSISLQSETRNWEQLYPNINRAVADMKFSSFPEISADGILFALPGEGGGLAYFDNQDSLNVFSIASNLGAVSISPDEDNHRIFCAFGSGSNGDGLYEFDLETEEFELINWFFYPQFVKKLSSGFYYGYNNGLIHSALGNIWEPIEFFNSKQVTDIEENGDGTLFVSVGNEIYMENNGGFTSFNPGLVINDIYIRNYPHNDEVYLACGDGGYINILYRVEYNSGIISGLTSITEIYYPHRIYEYREFLVVGCNDQEGLYLVEPEENGQVQQISFEPGIENIYCFESYPIYEHNFLVGTSSGVYLLTNLTSANDTEIEAVNSFNLSNYPNPFKPSGAGRSPGTTISFNLTKELTRNTEIGIFNIKGQKIKTLPIPSSTLSPITSITWNGTDHHNSPVSSGIYFAILKSGYRVLASNKMVLIK